MNDLKIGDSHYWFILHYYMYHYGIGIHDQGTAQTATDLIAHTNRFQGNGVSRLNGKILPNIIDAQGGLLGKNILLSSCWLEDVNVDAKQRLDMDACMPLVIASPNQFPTPKYRMTGAITYQPSYAVVANEQNLNNP